jgi:hypothetical protein
MVHLGILTIRLSRCPRGPNDEAAEPLPTAYRPARMSNPIRPLLLAVLASVLVACSPGAIASLLPAGDGPLVSITQRGGECPEGECGGTTVIDRDGTVRITEPDPFLVGTVPPEVLAVLDATIKTTDFAGIRAVPFTGECPVNFDGQEQIYEFGAPGGVQRIASCETEIDPDHPLFRAIDAAMGSVSEGG